MPPRPPTTSSKIPPILQQHSPIDSPLNPKFKMLEDTTSAPTKRWKIPLLRLKCQDICNKGSAAFFATVNAEKLLKEAVIGVLESLYTYKSQPTTVRSVTLILRSMNGVAYTTGSDLDPDHKEIHFSTDYIKGVHERSDGGQDLEEILGVVRHEMVHCFQFNGQGTANGGLIEGIADWVRLQAGFCPSHWERGGGSKWDDGYQNTAYFLQYLEDHFGAGSVPRINEYMRDNKYSEKLWINLFGAKPEKLWQQYKESIDDEKSSPVPTTFVTKVVPKTSSAEASSSTTSSSQKEKNQKLSNSPAPEPTQSKATTEVHAEAINNFLRAAPFVPPSEARIIARERLSRLEYPDSNLSFPNFVLYFERLLNIVDPNMADQEKLHLLGTSLKYDRYMEWYVMLTAGSSSEAVSYKGFVEKMLELRWNNGHLEDTNGKRATAPSSSSSSS